MEKENRSLPGCPGAGRGGCLGEMPTHTPAPHLACVCTALLSGRLAPTSRTLAAPSAGCSPWLCERPPPSARSGGDSCPPVQPRSPSCSHSPLPRRCEEPGLRTLQLHPYLIALLPFCLWTWDQGPWDPWTVCPDLVLLQAWWSLGIAQLSSTSSCPEMLLLLAPFQGQGGAVPREAQGHLCGLRPAGVLVYMYLSEAGPPPPSLGHSQLSGAGGVTLSSSGLIPALFSRTTLTCCSGQALGAFLCLSLCSQERADKLIHSQVEVTNNTFKWIPS